VGDGVIVKVGVEVGVGIFVGGIGVLLGGMGVKVGVGGSGVFVGVGWLANPPQPALSDTTIDKLIRTTEILFLTMSASIS